MYFALLTAAALVAVTWRRRNEPSADQRCTAGAGVALSAAGLAVLVTLVVVNAMNR